MSKIKNVMITSSGRRATLLEEFYEVVHERGGEVFAGDLNSLAPTLYLADHAVELPAIKNEEYIPFIKQVVRKYDINVIVPTLDPELKIYAAHYDEFKELGCAILISSEDFIEVTADKYLTAHTFAEKGIVTPASWEVDADRSKMPDDLYIKPRDGSASIDVYKIKKSELDNYIGKVPNAMIQEELVGDEITIDAMLSEDGKPLHFVARKRIRTLAGESIVGVTLDDKDIDDWCVQVMKVAGELGARWVITLQAFLTDKGPVLTEINARFGGGVPLAFAAGGEYPEWIMAMLNDESPEIELGEYERGLYFSRYMTEVFTKERPW